MNCRLVVAAFDFRVIIKVLQNTSILTMTEIFMNMDIYVEISVLILKTGFIVRNGL